MSKQLPDDFDEEVPQWDIALAALAREESQKLERPLTLADFRRLAGEYAIRFDDIMVTVFELCIHGEWEYRADTGALHPIEREAVDRLYVGGRLAEKDVAEFTGHWRPLE